MTRIDGILMEKVLVLVQMAAQRDPDVVWHTLTIEQNPLLPGSVVVRMDGKTEHSEDWHLETVMT